MRTTFIALLPIMIAGCSPTAHSPDAGAGGASGTLGDGASLDAQPASTSASGVGCGQDPGTGATLCRGILSCPSTTVDPAIFPDCGFRIRGGTLDLECSCSGFLCPLGAPASCAEAASLLRQQTEGTVCTQVSEGRCAGGGAAVPEAGTASGCDSVCRSECGGDPSCVTLCGC